MKSRETDASPTPWRNLCRELGLDPQEVKSVSSRYDMYKTFTDAQGGETLNLPRWYKWYRVEKLSEGHAMLAPPVQGCSVGPEIETDGPIVSEPDFLQLLEIYRSQQSRSLD
jgi:hypothetical protein